MKILLISSYIFGYMDFAVEEMKRQGHEVEVFYFEDESLDFQYKSIVHKACCGISKLMGNNAKKNYREKALKFKLKNESFDFTLMIHGQYLNDETHQFLKSITKKYVAYFFDSLTKMPEQKKIAHHFDKVFSYEPEDCEKYGYEFITNFIPSTALKSQESDFKVFNISTQDHRFSLLRKIAEYFNEKQIQYHFMLYSKKGKEIQNFEISSRKIDFQTIANHIKNATCLLDIQRKDQKGLSFRPYEAIGNHKKLITTNPEIQSYDFYHPNNILVIDPEKIKIPKDFLETDYQALPQEIYEKYTLRNWVKKILSDQ